MGQEDPKSDMGSVLNLRVSMIAMELVGRVQPGVLHPFTEELDLSVLSVKRNPKSQHLRNSLEVTRPVEVAWEWWERPLWGQWPSQSGASPPLGSC